MKEILKDDYFLQIGIASLFNKLGEVIISLPAQHKDIGYIICVQGGRGFDLRDLRKDVKVFFNDSFGVSKNRNHAISEACSKFILFCDDDIELNLEELVKLLYLLKENEEKLSCILLDVISSGGTRVFGYKKLKKIGKREALKCWAVRLCVKTSVARSIMFHEEISLGTDIPLGEETVFVFHCILKGLSFYKVPIAPAKLKTEIHTGIRVSNDIFLAKGIISAYIWKYNFLFYIYNLTKLFIDVVFVTIRKRDFAYLYKYKGIFLFLTNKELKNRLDRKNTNNLLNHKND